MSVEQTVLSGRPATFMMGQHSQLIWQFRTALVIVSGKLANLTIKFYISLFRGATWVALHNGGGVGWGEVINGGFGLLLDGSKQAEKNLKSMLHWDVNNGIARRSWARNKGAIQAIKTAMKKEKLLKITLPNIVKQDLINKI